jgi:predicted dehydrogenase
MANQVRCWSNSGGISPTRITTRPEASVVQDLSRLAGKGLDVIFVTTPIPSHFSIIKEVYSRQIARHVFVEKTLTSSYGDSKELCSMAEKVSSITMVGYQRKFGVTYAKAREVLRTGAVGNLTSFEAHAFSSDFAQGVGGGKGDARGGVLRDLGSHAIDMALWFFGDLEAGPPLSSSPSAADGAQPLALGAKTAGGIEGVLRASWSVPGYRMAEIGISVEGDRGTLSANDDMVELNMKGAPPTRWYRQDLDDGVPFLLGGPEYYRQDAELVRCLREGRSAENSFESASRVDQIIGAAEGSSN